MKLLILIVAMVLLSSPAFADPKCLMGVPQSRCGSCECMIDSRIEMIRLYEHYYTSEPRFTPNELEDCIVLLEKVENRICDIQRKYNVWDWESNTCYKSKPK
jgi:hypothetical protein